MSPPTGGYRDYDEDDVGVRASGRRKSRPRTKTRPEHAAAASAWVLAVDRGRYTCRLEDRSTGRADGTAVVAVRARELGRRSVVVGDQVAVVGDLSGEPGTLARIVRIEPRRTVLRRSADDVDPEERVIVANADQLAIVTSSADPAPRRRLIDRCLVAAFDGRLHPLLVVTKTDLDAAEQLREDYAALDVPVVLARRDRPVQPVLAALREQRTVLVGASGVGKSTLVNAMVPEAGRAVGTVNPVTGRGRHTSSSAVALELPDGGWVIDTPGVRTFGLAHVDPARVVHAFEDLEAGTAACPRGCDHLGEYCALDAWVAAGQASPQRLESLRRLLRSREGEDEPAEA